jgi:hypothetical protein
LDGKRYKEVKSTATIVEIDISDISAGMYMIRIVGINSKAYLLPVVKK